MKKRLMKTAAVLTALVMCFSMSISIFAAGNLTEKEALKLALKNAKLEASQVKNLSVDYDARDGVYEIEFIKRSNRADYDYEISKDTGKIVVKSIEYANKHNASKNKIGKAAALKKAAVYSKISLDTIRTGTCRYKYEDREGKYEIKFKYGKYRYEIDVQAATGKIMEFESKMIIR